MVENALSKNTSKQNATNTMDIKNKYFIEKIKNEMNLKCLIWASVNQRLFKLIVQLVYLIRFLYDKGTWVQISPRAYPLLFSIYDISQCWKLMTQVSCDKKASIRVKENKSKSLVDKVSYEY